MQVFMHGEELFNSRDYEVETNFYVIIWAHRDLGWLLIAGLVEWRFSSSVMLLQFRQMVFFFFLFWRAITRKLLATWTSWLRCVVPFYIYEYNFTLTRPFVIKIFLLFCNFTTLSDFLVPLFDNLIHSVCAIFLTTLRFTKKLIKLYACDIIECEYNIDQIILSSSLDGPAILVRFVPSANERSSCL